VGRRTLFLKTAMKRKLFLVVACLAFFVRAVYAQDILMKRNGEDIKTKIAEVSTDVVKYRKFEYLTGPVHNIATSEVFMIKYEDGSKDVFEKDSATGAIRIKHVEAEAASSPAPLPSASPTPAKSANQVKQVSNGTFEILAFDGASVSFRAVVETPVYSVSQVLDGRTVKASSISNTKGNIRRSNGTAAEAGSSLLLNKTGIRLLKNTEVRCSFNNVPSGFVPKTIVFLTGENADPMSYDLVAGAWIKSKPTTKPEQTKPQTVEQTKPQVAGQPKPSTPKPEQPKPTTVSPDNQTPASKMQVRQVDNGTFEMLAFDGSSVSFRAMVETPVYSVSQVSGGRTIKASNISNTRGDIRFSNGATAIAGSSLRLNKTDMLLSKNTEVRCSFDDVPAGFVPETIVLLTSENADPMSYDIAAGDWIKPEQPDDSQKQEQSQDVPETDNVSGQTVTEIKFPDGSCTLKNVNVNTSFPFFTNDKDNNFDVELEYTVKNANGKRLSEVLNILYEQGRFVAPDGRGYKAKAAFTPQKGSTYYLIATVPKDVDVLTLVFVFDGQRLELRVKN
jgi:hypothetical protein